MALSKNLSLNKRKEDCRLPSPLVVKKFDISEIKQHFFDSIKKIEDLTLIYKKINDESILRAQIVFLDSAFDFFMHEITKFCLSEMFEQNWERTSQYNNLKINLNQLHKILDEENRNEIFLECINSMYQSVFIISYESIQQQFKLLGLESMKIFHKCFPKDNKDKSKKAFNEFFDCLYSKRNCIAHQSSRSHLDATIKSFSPEFSSEAIATTKKVVTAIVEEIELKNR